ncbi:MAG TPA: ABC transporter permease [Pyrinomonadaceae bacterium]|nr:ABC transporter permease [Pyrinomonadaceae bacterium]
MNSLVFSNMLHRPARTIVSVIGIGIGILLIVFTIGLANGSLRERAQREENVGAEIMLRPEGSVGLSGSDSLKLPVSMAVDIEKVDGVAAVIPIGETTVAATEGLTGSRILDGVPYDKYAEVAGLQIIRGRKFVDGRDEMMADEAWFAQHKAKIGDKFTIYERDFEIVGSYEPSAGARIKIPLLTMQNQVGAADKANILLVKLKDGFTAETVRDNIQAKFPALQIIRTSDLEELYMQGIPALNVFLNVVVGVAGAIAGLIILLTMYTTVTERTRQIGVMKSLGMSKTGIAWTIVQEALLLSLGGVVFGVAATVVLKYVFAKWTTLTVSIDPKTVATIVVVGIISGIIGALYPGIRAARLDAVEALNYD